MNDKYYDVLAFIGRFQPFHDGHKAVIDKALELSQRVAIIIGSHNQPRNIRNPFTTAERIEIISAAYPDLVGKRLFFVPQEDHTYNLDRWIAGIQTGVSSAAATLGWRDRGHEIGIIGHPKDGSSFYLNCFPRWDYVEVPNYKMLDATHIREQMFGFPDRAPLIKHADVMMPSASADVLQEIVQRDPELMPQMLSEWEFVRSFKESWSGSPYPPTFQTVDTVVVQSGHVLLVKRGQRPGKGLWALPGGYLDVNRHEKLVDAAIRELREETRLDVPTRVLKRYIEKTETFDDPWRSPRGRIITNAYYIRLRDEPDLPKVKGSDDAERAKWVPLSELDRSMMFEDHMDIIETMVSI